MKSDVKNDLKSLINYLVEAKKPFKFDGDASKSHRPLEHSKAKAGKKFTN